jgi:hypothetical protein
LIIRESAFRQKGVYATRVWISSKNGKIYEPSSHIKELAIIINKDNATNKP